MITKKDIENFYTQKKIALIGVSRNKKEFGNIVYAELKKKAYDVFPVNKHTDKINEDVCYKEISQLPNEVTAAVVLTPSGSTYSIVEQLIQKNIKHIWLQQTSDTPEAIELAQKEGVHLIYGKCILMFSEPVTGFHKFHRTLLKIFGRLPK